MSTCKLTSSVKRKSLAAACLVRVRVRARA